MIPVPALFLTVALSLPGCSYPHVKILSENVVADELRKLRDFIQKQIPGAEITVTIDETDYTDSGMEKFPVTWRGMYLWIRRPTVMDNPPINRRSA